MKKIIFNIAVLTTIIILTNTFTASAGTEKGNTTEKAKTEKTKSNTSATPKSNTKTPAKHKFFIHFINIVNNGGQYA